MPMSPTQPIGRGWRVNCATLVRGFGNADDGAVLVLVVVLVVVMRAFRGEFRHLSSFAKS